MSTPTLSAVAIALETALAGKLPFCNVVASDRICSSVCIHASHDERETWANRIFHNSRYFIAHVRPANGERVYTGGALVCEVFSSHYGLPVKFRKVTGTAEKIAAKLAAWVELCK